MSKYTELNNSINTAIDEIRIIRESLQRSKSFVAAPIELSAKDRSILINNEIDKINAEIELINSVNEILFSANELLPMSEQLTKWGG